MTQDQSIAAGLMNDLKFEQKPPKKVGGHTVMGGPSEFVVSDETIKYIKSLKGKTLVVGGDGTMTIE